MYISENYLGFYSYLIGFELKILIELKDIKDIIKEPIRKLFRHSMRIVTKENQEVHTKSSAGNYIHTNHNYLTK
jgi:uncharacterized protein Smg (DUF494 family)